MQNEFDRREKPEIPGSCELVSRRKAMQVLSGGAGVFATLSAVPISAVAAIPDLPEWMQDLVFERLGKRNFQEGRIVLDLPDRADTGLSVPLIASVPDSPMIQADYVQSLHVLTTRNPQPLVTDYFFTPRSGIAKVSQRIRLAQSQYVFGFSIMSDGSAWMAAKHVTVSFGACAAEIFLPDARRSSRRN